MTLKELAQRTIDVQDACNLSGVAQSFAAIVLELRRSLNLGTDDTNTHPIVICWLDKMNSLAGIQPTEPSDTVSVAYMKVTEWANG